MKARLFDSVEQMLAPEGLASIVGTPVEGIEHGPLEVKHYSGNTLEHVTCKSDGRVVSFVLKRFSIEKDWIMRVTHDTEVREVALFRGGVYQRIPDLCIIPVVAAAREDRSWASLMVDVSEYLLPDGSTPLPVTDLRRCLEHLAAIHARFMEDESLLQPSLGLSSLRDFILILSRPVIDREIEQGHTHPVLDAARKGWDIFGDVGMPEAVRIVKKTQQDLRPLLRALARAPRTLVHGDYKIANLGVWSPPSPPAQVGDAALAAADVTAVPAPPEPRTVIIDWQDATFGSPLLDMAYFLAINSSRLPVSKEDAIQLYRDSLASFGFIYQPHAWARDLEVGLLAGGGMRLVWQKALGTQAEDPLVRARETEEVRWWSEQIIRGSRWFS